MHDQVWLVCHVCKCEFAADLIQLRQQPQRACPNCGQLFDIRGMGLLTDGLQRLAEAATLVNFRLKGDQQLAEAVRTIQALQVMIGQHNP